MSRLQLARGVGVVEEEGVVYAAPLPGGPIVVLEGVAALIWAEARGGERESVAARVALATGESADAIGTEVDAFVGELVERGLLVPEPD